MPRILPFSLIILTTISIVLCITTVTLAFLNLDLAWAGIIAGVMTGLYHLLVIILAWLKSYSSKRSRSQYNTSNTPPLAMKGQKLKPSSKSNVELNHGLNIRVDVDDVDDHNHIRIPYPVTLLTLGIIILSIWIITFGATIDIAMKGFKSNLAPSMIDLKKIGKVPKIDYTELVASTLVSAVEIVIIALFLWCCLKGKKKYDEERREKMEDKWFYPITPVFQTLSRATSVKSFRRLTTKSFRSTMTKGSNTLNSDKLLPKKPLESIGAPHLQNEASRPPRYPFLLSPPEPVATTRRHRVSPWEYMTPANPTPAPSSIGSTSFETERIGTTKLLTPLRRPLSSARVI